VATTVYVFCASGLSLPWQETHLLSRMGWTTLSQPYSLRFMMGTTKFCAPFC
jgi:hypothetical protein